MFRTNNLDLTCKVFRWHSESVLETRLWMRDSAASI